MYCNLIFLSFLFVNSIVNFVESLDVGETCVTPNLDEGKCVLVKDCPQIQELLSRPVLDPNDITFITSSRCGAVNKKALVCCKKTPEAQYPDSTVETVTEVSNRFNPLDLLPSLGICGSQSTDKIVGGQKARIDEYPWLALIQYRKRDGKLEFNCGGSLISTRYVVTAQHCISVAQNRGWQITGVRLGEWDLNSDLDCMNVGGEKLCSDPVIDVGIEKIIDHEHYNPRFVSNDIALIRLSQNIQFTDYVTPICLPLQDQSKDYNNNRMIVAGWGKTENNTKSNVKLFVGVNGVDLYSCQQVYPTRDITDKQLCAGGKKGKDSCQGDSGGPLMDITSSDKGPLYFLAGVVSFGKGCGNEGVPGVYTKVSMYIDWILSNMEP